MTTYYKLALLFVLLLGASCTADDWANNPSARAEIKATIGQSAETKATLRTDDGLSYAQFETGDQIGFYAQGGLEGTNEELTYDNGSFLRDALQWTDDNAHNIFAYYPYSADQTEINIWRPSAGGLPDGFNDMLIANKSSVTHGTSVQLEFHHHFAMLIIQRGVGFETPASGQEAVSVNLNASVGKTAAIKGRNGIELKKDDTDGVNTLSAHKGPVYKGADSWYVIVPIGNFATGDGKAQVESITLYNNNKGHLMTIPYTRKDLASSTKYLVTVRLRNDVAVIEPEEIIRWGDEKVHIEQLPGIHDEEGFKKWLAAYNGGSTADLGAYGSSEHGKWTFRLLNDIEIKTWSPNNAAVITTFSDLFDGQGHTISGLKLNGTSAHTGFFGTLSGTVQNLILKDISLEGTTDVGAIAGSNTGTIKNCQVTGFSVVVGTDRVGGLVGNNTGAITGCASSAIVSGTDPKLLVGSGTEADDTNLSTGVVVKK